MQGWWFRNPIEKYFVGVTVFESKVEMTLKGFAKSARSTERGKQFATGPDAQGAKNVVAVAVAFVDSWRRRAGRLGYRSHGERFFSAARPQPRGRAENTLFQIGVGMPWQSFLQL
jgi:hypothetical protein